MSEAPDIVYICRPGDDNEELRYSLRSLVNIPHGEVHIVGGWPSWVRGVNTIAVESFRDKQTSAVNNLIAACQNPGISDPFLVLNDDFYIMAPMDKVPVLHLGPMDQVIEAHRFGSAYRNAMQKTADRLRTLDVPQALVSYETHTPMLIDKVGMLLALSLGKGIHGLHNRTMYGNLEGLGGIQTSDVKVYRGTRGQDYREWSLLSTSDQVFKFHPVGRHIKSTFPDPCSYEFIPKTRPLSRGAVRYSSAITTPK